MNIRKFLDNLAYFIDAPNGIDGAKELILSLAYQGRLVEPSGNDSITLLESLPYSTKALKRFSEEQRSRAGNATVPIHWEWVELIRIGRHWGQKKPTEDFTYIDVSSIDSRRGCITEDPAIVMAGSAPSRARKVVKPGTRLFNFPLEGREMFMQFS